VINCPDLLFQVEQRKLQQKAETTRLKANSLLNTPSDLDLNLVESELNNKACQAACREIDALRQYYRDEWRRVAAGPDQNTVLKDIDLERTKLIHLEVRNCFLILQKDGDAVVENVV